MLFTRLVIPVGYLVLEDRKGNDVPVTDAPRSPEPGSLTPVPAGEIA